MQAAAGAVALDQARAELAARPRRWLVTGSAGFIGSHLVQTLLAAGQDVVGLDNFATGHRSNLDEVRRAVGDANWRRHRFIEGDIADWPTCVEACERVQIVLHEAALGSVPRSIEDPRATHAANVTGFLNLLIAARDAGATRFVYAASSSTYGDHPDLPKVEDRIGRPLSPYAVTKYLNELYADVFGRCYGMATVGLRYFNVFGAAPGSGGRLRRRDSALGRRDAVGTAGHDLRRRRDDARLLLRRQRRAGEPARRADRRSGRDRPGLQRRRRRTHVAERAAPDASARSSRPGTRSLRSRPRATSRSAPATSAIRRPTSAKARTLLGYVPTHGVREGLVAAMPWYETRVASAGRSAARAVGA